MPAALTYKDSSNLFRHTTSSQHTQFSSSENPRSITTKLWQPLLDTSFREPRARPKIHSPDAVYQGFDIDASTPSIVDTLVQQFEDIEGIELKPNDQLLLESFIDDVEAAGGLSMLESFLNAQPVETGGIFHYWLDYLYDVYEKFFTDFRDFKALRHACITGLLEKKDNHTLTIQCIEPGTGQEAYSLPLMLDQAVPELNDWIVRPHTSNQRHFRYQRCKAGRFNTRELNQRLPDGPVSHPLRQCFSLDESERPEVRR